MHLNRLKCSALLIKNSRILQFYGCDQVGSVKLRFGFAVRSCSLPKLFFLCGSKSCNRLADKYSIRTIILWKETSHLFTQQIHT